MIIVDKDLSLITELQEIITKWDIEDPDFIKVPMEYLKLIRSFVNEKKMNLWIK